MQSPDLPQQARVDVQGAPLAPATPDDTAIQYSVGRVKKRSTFDEEKVIVYDLKTKLSSKGTVVEVLGNNTYW